MLSALLLLLAPAQDLHDLAERLRAATDRASFDARKSYAAAKELIDLRGPEAMALRLELYDGMWSSYRGVYLRDRLYSGMRRAASPAENLLLAEAAADRDRSAGMRLLCLRALEASSGSVPAEPLLERRFLKEEPALRRAWERVLGGLLAAGRLDFAEVRAREPRAAALKLLEDCEPRTGYAAAGGAGAAELLARTVADAEDPRDRALALRALAAVDARRFAQAGERAFREPYPGPRCAFLEAAVRHDLRDAVPGILRSMRWAHDEELARWPADCGSALRALTGMRIGNDPALWERWWQERGEAWLAQPRNAVEAPAEPEASDTVARFFGLAVDSTNVVVLVDGSGSMSMNMLGELDCARAAAAEAQRFLEALGDDALFNVGVVEVEPAMAFDSLKRTRGRDIGEAVEFLRRRAYRSRSALVEALQAATADPRVDTVVLISDGGSSDGLHQHPEHMLEAVGHLHRATGLRIHTVLVTDSDTHRRFMQELAAATGGRAIRAGG